MSATLGVSIKEVHSGTLTKMGGNIKNWNKRWMILRSNHTLQYYKEPTKPAKGTINLNDINFDVAIGNKTSCNWPKNCNVDYSLVLTTTSRTYYMFAESEIEAEHWLTHLQTYADEAGKARGTNSTLPSRYNKIGGKATDLATPTAVNTDKDHMPKMYKKKDRRLPTKRFNTTNNNDEGEGDDDDITDDEILDVDPDGTIDGPADMHKFQQHSEMSLSMSIVSKCNDKEDSIYVLAGSTDGKPPLPRVTSPNTNNNNGGTSSKASSVVDIHESLYDLVGRINAGEDKFSNNVEDDLKQQNMYDEIQRRPSVEQDVYEPMTNDQGLSPDRDPSPTHSSKPLPIKYNTPTLTTSLQRTSLGNLPPIPDRPVGEIYEQLDEPTHQPLALYDEIERKNNLVHESDSSGDESDSPPPIPPPIPKPRSNTKSDANELDGYYDNTPSLPVKLPSRPPSPLPPLPPRPLNNDDDDDDEYYGNAPLLPSKPNSPSPPPSTTIDDNRPLKSPVPTPRVKLSINNNSEMGPIYDDCIVIVPSASGNEAIYDDTVAMVTHNSSTVSSVDSNTCETSSTSEPLEEGKSNENQEESNDKDHFEYQVSNNEMSVCPINEEDNEKVYFRTSPKKVAQRVHSATTGSYDQGIAMFHKRAQYVSVHEGSTITDGVKQLLLEESLDQIEKTTLAQSLREIEQQKQLASEEKYKWERERLKLEEERRKFEEEKRRFQEEMQKMQQAKVND